MPIKYVPFIPEPVEGQAVLGNFNRILRYKGADDVSMTLQRGMPLYEMEKQETVGENSDGNMVIRGECVSACAYLKEQGIQVDLVYIDPPFASGADYAKKVYIRRNPKVAEVIAQAEQELDVDELKAFEEKMYGDVWDKEKYLNWMYENLMAIKSVMSENASIYVHIDWHIGHYVKILLDEVFGEDNFRNEITWVRTASHNDSKQNYSRVKDSIFFYSRSEEYPFNIQYTPYTEEYIADEWTKALSGPKLNGTSEEKQKYWKIKRLHETISKALEWAPVEKAFSGMNCIKLAIQNCGKAIDEDAEIMFEVPKESLLTLGEFPKFNNAEIGYLLTDCDMSILFGIEGTSEYIEYSESEQNGRTSYGARPYGLPGYVPDYSDDFTDEIKDVFCYGFYSSEDKYIVKLKVDYIKHNTTVAFPTILFVKNEIDEIPYKITSKNNPDVVEGCIKVKS